MIEKIIHYCWFGGEQLPKKYKKYINTWKKYFPEYKIIEWNENNFPINDYVYAKEAFEKEKYAFVSDVARMYALYNFGGIYFDTDVEVVSDFYDILNENVDSIIGEETISRGTFGTGFLALTKAHIISKKFLEMYENEHFIENDGKLNQYPNTFRLADVMKELYGVIPSGNLVVINKTAIYPQDYFTAFDDWLLKNKKTKNTRCIHHFACSWLPKSVIFRRKIRTILRNIFRFRNRKEKNHG